MHYQNPEVGSRGIYVYDRGGDRNEIFRYFISNGLDFIVRMMQTRYLMYEGVRTNILLLAAKCHTPHTSVVAFNANGEEKDTTIHYGAMPVRLPENPDFPGMHEKDLRLVLAVAYFVMVWIGKSERREVLRTHIVETAKRIYGAPEFFYYALADGIQKLFTRFGKWSAKLDLRKVLLKPSPQLEFAFASGDG